MIPDFLFRLLSTVVGIVIPAYRSYKALEYSYHDGQVHHYLKYWIVFGVFSLIEFWVDIVLFWIPFYNELKLGMLVWLQLPQTRGAVAVYDSVIKPLVNQHEDNIDAKVADVTNHVSRKAKEGVNKVLSQGTEAVQTFANKVVQDSVNTLLTPKGAAATVEEDSGDNISDSHKKSK